MSSNANAHLRRALRLRKNDALSPTGDSRGDSSEETDEGPDLNALLRRAAGHDPKED